MHRTHTRDQDRVVGKLFLLKTRMVSILGFAEWLFISTDVVQKQL